MNPEMEPEMERERDRILRLYDGDHLDADAPRWDVTSRDLRRDIAHVTWTARSEAPSTVRRVPPSRRPDLRVLGWREWVALPDWDVPHLKAKVDTGARTSSLHAFDLEIFHVDDTRWVRFDVHPWQRSTADAVSVETPVFSARDVKSSSGLIDHRPVVRASILLGGVRVDAEITLTRRDEMGFRMLIGREAIRRRFLVDPGVSYLGGRPPKSIRTRNSGRT
jgi:hypothetical protein